MKTATRWRSVLLAGLLICLGSLSAWSQTNSLLTISDNPSITITTATATSDKTSTAGIQRITLEWRFGTVSGSYTSCTVQAQTTYDGSHYLNIGDAASVTVTSNTANSWSVSARNQTTPTTTAAAFGQNTKWVFACSAYGTSAPVTINLIGSPNPLPDVFGAIADSAAVPGDAGTIAGYLRAVNYYGALTYTAVSDTTPVSVYPTATSTGAATPYTRALSTTTTGINVKATPGVVSHIFAEDLVTTARYVRFYDSASTPDCTSATGIVWRGVIGPPSTTPQVGGFANSPPVGIQFSSGIGYCLTASVSDTANDTITAGDVIFNFLWN